MQFGNYALSLIGKKLFTINEIMILSTAAIKQMGLAMLSLILCYFSLLEESDEWRDTSSWTYHDDGNRNLFGWKSEQRVFDKYARCHSFNRTCSQLCMEITKKFGSLTDFFLFTNKINIHRENDLNLVWIF